MKKNLLLFLLISSSGFAVAQANLDSLYKVWEDRNQPDSNRVFAFYDYINEGYLDSQPDSALILTDRLYQFSNGKSYKKGMAKALYLQSLIYFGYGDNVNSIAYSQRSLKLFEEIEDKDGIAYSLLNIGGIYFVQEDDVKALEYSLKVLELLEELGDKGGMAVSFMNIANIYSDRENYDMALKYYFDALKIFEEIGDKGGTAHTFSNIGNNYFEMGDLPKSLDYLQQGLTIFQQLGDLDGIAFCLMNIGDTYLEQGNYKKAIDNCKKGLDAAKEAGEISIQVDACECLYDAYKAIGDGTKALAYHEEMLELSNSLNSEETAKNLQSMEFAKQVLADSLIQVEKDIKVEMTHQNESRKKDNNRNIAIGIGLFFVLLSAGFYGRWRYIKKAKAVIEKEKDRSENLLLNILPAEIAEELKIKGKADARDFDLVSILFTDFKGFTEVSEKLTAKELIGEINHCFKAFDHICGKFGIEKIKTIGDAYMAAGGLPVPSEDSVKNSVLAALEMQAFISERINEKKAKNEIPFEMRLGIHTGPVVAGIVGVKKFQYDIWGDTVNTAARMESSGEIGKVNISETTYKLIKDDPQFSFEARGKIVAKGKGELKMFFVTKSS